ncbi:MAG: class I SAM-dependent methyltransferase, partial [Candidatus Omnitrophica bacterium]|nr:class I SAM-dependent methyltransferase [Candidatus Omnitrophota bacterium]
TEITAEVFKRRYAVYEVPISYNGRSYDEGKKIKWTDFFRCVFWLLRSISRGINVGESTLLRMRMMKNNNRWTFKKIEPFLGKKVLELGSGIGTFSRYLIARGRSLTLTDINPAYINHLQNRFGANPSVDIFEADIGIINEVLAGSSFDTIVGINVLEHIEKDSDSISRLKVLLKDEARLVLVVPAHRFLFGRFDQNLHHRRRYSKKELTAKLEEKGFLIEKIEFMNALGALGWFLNFKILKRKSMPAFSTRCFDRLIPLVACCEKCIKFPFGLSLFCVAKKRIDK